MESDFLPSDFVNCTGLRFCLANGAAPLRWVQNTNAEVDAKNHVYEMAAGIQRSAAQGRHGVRGPLGQPGGSTRQVFELRRGRFLEARTQLADRRFGAVAQHPFVRLPRAEPQRSVPACRRHVDRVPGPAHGRQQPGHAPRLARQSGPDSGNGEDNDGGRRVDSGLHPALQLRGRLLRDQVDERDHQHHLSERRHPGPVPGQRACVRFELLLAGDPADHGSERSQLPESRLQHADRNPRFTAQRGAAENQGLRFPARLQLRHGGRAILAASPGELSADELHAQHAGFAVLYLGACSPI